MSGIDISVSETEQRPQNEAIRQLAQGRSNAVGEFQILAGTTTTTVDKDVDKAAANMSQFAAVFWSPTEQNSAQMNPSIWVSGKGQGFFTLTHASLPFTDMWFDFEVRGG